MSEIIGQPFHIGQMALVHVAHILLIHFIFTDSRIFGVDLLASANLLPLPSGITYVKGYEGYPAFDFSINANLRKFIVKRVMCIVV